MYTISDRFLWLYNVEIHQKGGNKHPRRTMIDFFRTFLKKRLPSKSGNGIFPHLEAIAWFQLLSSDGAHHGAEFIGCFPHPFSFSSEKDNVGDFFLWFFYGETQMFGGRNVFSSLDFFPFQILRITRLLGRLEPMRGLARKHFIYDK